MAGYLRVHRLFVHRAWLGRGRPLLNASMNAVRCQVLPVICDLWFVTVLTKVYCERQAAWCSQRDCASWQRVIFISTARFCFCYVNNTIALTPMYLPAVNNILLGNYDLFYKAANTQYEDDVLANVCVCCVFILCLPAWWINKRYNAEFHIDTFFYSRQKEKETAEFKALRKFYNLQLHA